MSAVKLSEKFEPMFRWLVAERGDPLFEVDTIIVTGGRFSQKSFAVGTWSCTAAKDFVHRVLYTRYTLTSAKDSIIPEFVEKIDILNSGINFSIQKDRITSTEHKAKIVFKGLRTSSGKQTASLKSLKDFSMFVVDEGEEIPTFEEWQKIKLSIRATDVRNVSVIMLNPALKTHWIYEEFFEALGVQPGFNGIVGNVLYIHTTYIDVEREYIPANIWADFMEKKKAYDQYQATPKDDRDNLPRRLIKNALYYKYAILGGWLDSAEGVILEDWEYGLFDESLPFAFGQDFGYSSDPTTLVKCAVDNKRKMIYVKACFGKPGMSTEAIYLANLFHAGPKGLITADSQEARLIDEVKAKGINMKKAKKGPGSVKAGLKAMMGYKIIVDHSSPEIAVELNSYVWHDKKAGVPVDLWNHYIDAIRYCVHPLIGKVKRERSKMKRPI